MRRNSKGFAPILILILVILVGLGAYYFGTQKGKITPLSTPTPSSTPTPMVAATSSPTSVAHATPNVPTDWKDYSTPTFGFLVKYPSSWKLSGDPETTRVNEIKIVSINNGKIAGGRGNPQLPQDYLGITALKTTKALQEFLNQECTAIENCAPDVLQSMDTKNVKVGNVDGVSYVEPGAMGRGRIFAISNGNYIFLFNFPDNYNALSNPIPTQILSTFKFTN